MTTLLTLDDAPMDCNNVLIRIGSIVYIPAGWNGDKPKPWNAMRVVGISYISNHYYLDLEGSIFYQCAARSVSVVQPYPSKS